MKHLVAPSILSANFAWLGRDIEMLNESEADWVHVDVMDGRFVPNISFGISVLKDIAPLSTKFMDVHLMIVRPEKYIQDFYKAECTTTPYILGLAAPAQRHPTNRKATGMKAGVAASTHICTHWCFILPELDVVLNERKSGFGGQKFIQATLQNKPKPKLIAGNRLKRFD